MSEIFIELYKYRPAWLALDDGEREQFVARVLGAMEGLVANGVEVIGWGSNNLETDRRAPYDYFCVYKVPSFAFQRAFDEAIVQSGWHQFFEQVAASGTIAPPSDILAANVARKSPAPIS